MIKVKLYQINASLKDGLTILHSTLDLKQEAACIRRGDWWNYTDPEIDMIICSVA
jgi:hypothetical protein